MISYCKTLAPRVDLWVTGSGGLAKASLVVALAMLAFMHKSTGKIFRSAAARSVPAIAHLRTGLLRGSTDGAKRPALGALGHGFIALRIRFDLRTVLRAMRTGRA